MRTILLTLVVVCLAAVLAWFRLGHAVARDDKGGTDDMTEQRSEMVRVLMAYGINDQRLLATMGKVRRHRFIPESYLWSADPYGDHPCPIGHGQTISQPYIVAYMTGRIHPQPGEKILEIGTGSGYQAAVLADLGADV